MGDIAVVGVFFAIALLHVWAEEHAHKTSLAWIAIAAHPAVMMTVKDWLVHIAVYSKWAILSLH